MAFSQYVAVSNRIREDILSGTFPAGGRLKIAELAELYNTSHMPIREALRLLDGEGLIDFLPNRGVRVRSVDAEFMTNVMDVRLALEPMLAARAAERLTRESAEAIVEARKAFERQATRGDDEALLKANHAFHGAVSAASGNLEAAEVEPRHWQILRVVWPKLGYPPERVAVVIDDHRHIEGTILDRDSEGASIMAAAHVMRAKRQLLAAMREQQSKAHEPSE